MTNFSETVVRELIEKLGFEKAFKFIAEEAPESLHLPFLDDFQNEQLDLFQDAQDFDLEKAIQEMNDFFDITPEDITSCNKPPVTLDILPREASWETMIDGPLRDQGYYESTSPQASHAEAA